MSKNYENKLLSLGISLPDAPAPAANYVPYVVAWGHGLYFWTNFR
jgi:hypothetical protein